MEAVTLGETRARAGLNWRPSSGAEYASLATRSVTGLTLRLRCAARAALMTSFSCCLNNQQSGIGR